MRNGNPYSFLVVLPGKILEIPQDSNLAWLTLFYALPKELVEKRPAYLEIPRNIHRLLRSEKHMKLIQSDAFLELVWDCYAWATWQFFQVPGKDGNRQDIPGDWSDYSGDFPLWRLSYEIQKHFRNQFETVMEWSVQRLFLMDDQTDLPWLSYKHFGNMVGNLTDKIVAEQNWQPMIDEIWNNRQVSDYTGKNLQMAERKLKPYFKDGKLPITAWHKERDCLEQEYAAQQTELSPIHAEVKKLWQIKHKVEQVAHEQEKQQRKTEQER